MHLAEITDTLINKGFIVAIAEDHESITVTLKNRRPSLHEVQVALNWDINHAIRFGVGRRHIIIAE